MKIDIFPHILPVKYKDALMRVEKDFIYKKSVIPLFPMLYDLELRFRLMDKCDGLMQVLTLAVPPVEDITDPSKAADLARLGNDELAELVAKYPERFAGAVASLPMNNMDAALKEVDRAINDLRLRGVQIFTPTNDKPLDSPEFMPLYERMAKYDLPIWLHPQRSNDFADYKTLKQSMYTINTLFGRPYETTVAMTHLIFSGVFDKLPNLKFITHHAGGLIPCYAERARSFYNMVQTTVGPAMGQNYMQRLNKPVLEYYKMFYADTMLDGNIPALMCAYSFFGADHLLLGTDMPLGDSQRGFINTQRIISSIEQMAISDLDKKKIFEDNARRLLRLPA